MSSSFGLFIVSQDRKILTANSWIPNLVHSLTEDDLENLPVEVFFSRLIELAEDPIRIRSAIELGINNVGDYPVIQFTLNLAEPRHMRMYLFPVDPDPESAWGGLLMDHSLERTQFRHQLHIVETLSSEARQTGARLKGNVNALSNNISTWPEEMVATFMSELEDQVNTLNWNLDQLILFEKSINQMVYFPEIIPVSDLIGFVLESLPEESSRVRWIAGESADLPGLHVDIGLTTIAFEYLLMEMLSSIPSGQGIEITAKSQDGNLSLSLVSNLPMTLPGLEEKLDVADPRDFNTQLHLAQHIISHQGGKLTIKERNSNSQIGLEVEVSLPTISTTDQSSLTFNLGAQDQDQAGRILLAISQPEYQALLQQIFSDQGYRVDLAVEGRGALDMAQRIQPDLILVDRTLPGLDGLLLTQGIRRWSSVPIIMISSRSDPDDLLHAFQAGVDDYIRTPFRSDEILVRVQAAVRRGIESKQDFAPDIFTSDQVRINYSTRQVWIRGIPASLTPTEYNLVAYMSRHQRQTLSYDQLIERAWPGPEKGTRQGLFVHIRRLRKKIEQDIQNPKIIQNKWGVGYIFYPDQHS